VHDDGLSMNWLECQGETAVEQLKITCGFLAQFRKIKARDQMAIFLIAKILAAGEKYSKRLCAIKDPIFEATRANPGHSLVQGLAQSDESVLQEFTLLASLKAPVLN
jgi:hypothetical protein